MVDSLELRFCQVLYFSSVKRVSWLDQARRLALKYADEVGRVVTHFDLWPADDRVSRTAYRYIKRNQARLVEAVADETLKGAYFYSVADDGDFTEAPLALSILTEAPLKFPIGDKRKERNYGIAILTCSLSLLRTHSVGLKPLLGFIRDMLDIVKVGYGLVHVMQARKFPGLYFSNSASSKYLTEEEKQDVESWRRHGWRFSTIVRSVYWGNVLSRSHWGNDEAKEKYLMSELKDICGRNVFWIDDTIVFFCAPVDILEYEQKEVEIELFKKRVHKVLLEVGIEVLS